MAPADNKGFANQFCLTLFSDSIVCTPGPSSPIGFGFGSSSSHDPQEWDSTWCTALFCTNKDKFEGIRAGKIGVVTHLYMEDGELKELIVRAPVCECCGELLYQASKIRIWPNGVEVDAWIKGLRDLASKENDKVLA